jgi:hypothetical protein
LKNEMNSLNGIIAGNGYGVGHSVDGLLVNDASKKPPRPPSWPEAAAKFHRSSAWPPRLTRRSSFHDAPDHNAISEHVEVIVARCNMRTKYG